MIGHIASSLTLLAQAAQVREVSAQSLHPTWCPAWAFWMLSLLTVAGALVTITRRNLIGAVMALVATFFALAGIYALLAAHFLAAIQVLVYAGAIMVLFVFVVMLLNAGEEDRTHGSKIATIAGIPGVTAIFCLLSFVFLSERKQLGTTQLGGYLTNTVSNITEISHTLFTSLLLPFEVTSILILVAILGAVVLARKEL